MGDDYPTCIIAVMAVFVCTEWGGEEDGNCIHGGCNALEELFIPKRSNLLRSALEEPFIPESHEWSILPSLHCFFYFILLPSPIIIYYVENAIMNVIQKKKSFVSLNILRYDMEDAMIINKSSMERGFAHGQIYTVGLLFF